MTLSLLALATLATAEPQLIVQLRPGADPAAVAKAPGVVLRDTTPNAPFALVGVASGTAAAAQSRLQADSRVAWAEDNADTGSPEGTAAGKPTLQTSKPIQQKGSSLGVIGNRSVVLGQNSNALSQIDFRADLAASAGRTVRLAILDTGLARAQAALWTKVDASFDAFGGDSNDAPMNRDSNGNGMADEAVGHGTMVAGIVDAVAPQVRLVVAKVADSDGRATAWTVVKGLAFAANAGAEVANLSMGSPTQVAAFNDVAEWCESKGLLVVAPVGNAGVEGAWYPARSSKALCVTGVDGRDVKAGFSGWDGTADATAPCVDVVSQWADGSLASWSGTSFAAPFVAGAVADCLRRTTPQRPKDLVKAVGDTGRNVDPINDRSLRGKLGSELDVAALNAKLAKR